jgi:hypothetical protein
MSSPIFKSKGVDQRAPIQPDEAVKPVELPKTVLIKEAKVDHLPVKIPSMDSHHRMSNPASHRHPADTHSTRVLVSRLTCLPLAGMNGIRAPQRRNLFGKMESYQQLTRGRIPLGEKCIDGAPDPNTRLPGGRAPC